ncbi:MAG: enoyl-CoA hydratase/isomerase family protein [Anaerolineales bacterium]|nr:MAG: enoyl-CoA hydratase/isomerase family protein [Anaerolineales bacterium]
MDVLKNQKTDFKEILYEKGNWVARITINRPQVYNSYSTNALEELATAFRQAAFDDEVAVIVLTGMGDKAFCTGGDVKEYQERYTRAPHDYWKYMRLFGAYIESIVNTGKPVVARINGMAVGGGNESNLACDLAVIAEHAWIGQVGTGVGSVAAGGATQWLPITVGDRRARYMLMTNRRIPSYQALEWGLVNEVVPSVLKDGAFIERATPEQIAKAQKGADGYSISLEKLDQAVDALAQELVDKFAECIRYTKENVNFWKNFGWHQTIGHARDWLSVHYTSWEPLEGMTAFVEKRPSRYRMLRERAAQGKSSEFIWGAYEKDCPACGAKALPEEFTHCGVCGAELK